jgi:hypothetical protein
VYAADDKETHTFPIATMLHYERLAISDNTSLLAADRD